MRPPPQGFPTIKLFTPGSSSPTDYQGPRSAKALADAAVGASGRAALAAAGDAAAERLQRKPTGSPSRPHSTLQPPQAC